MPASHRIVIINQILGVFQSDPGSEVTRPIRPQIINVTGGATGEQVQLTKT